jgi:hypothetical protein
MLLLLAAKQGHKAQGAFEGKDHASLLLESLLGVEFPPGVEGASQAQLPGRVQADRKEETSGAVAAVGGLQEAGFAQAEAVVAVGEPHVVLAHELAQLGDPRVRLLGRLALRVANFLWH